ncbi:hypothetical protein RDABS01_024956 [Bienertia sinuspersici]
MWNVEKLRSIFSDEEVELILQLPLSKRMPKDMRYWWPTVNGVFSTRSAYWLGRLGHMRGWALRFGSAASEGWRAVWRCGGPPKLSQFVWRACSGALATKGRLVDRHILDDGACDQCYAAEESITHAIFDCPLVKPIWDPSPFAAELTDAPKNSFMELLEWIKGRVSSSQLLVFLTLAWAAWSYRNSVVFNNPWRSLDVGVAGYLRLVADFQGYAEAVFSQRRVVSGAISRGSWSPPATGVLRINTDAAVMEGIGVGLGAVVRDEKGTVVAAGVQRVGRHMKVDMAEAMAMRFGLTMALELGFVTVELESDALEVVRAVNLCSFGRNPLGLILEDIVEMSNACNSFSISHVRRCGNTVAHSVARLYPENGYKQVFVDSFPQGILALAELD